MLEESATALLDAPLDDGLFEMINGIPVEKKMGAESSEISATMLILIGGYVRKAELGHMYDAQTGFQCFPNNPSLVRKPDVSFISTGRLTGRSPKGNLKIAPDLAVEVVSPHDAYEDVEIKLRDYREAGVRLIWVLSPQCRTVRVIRADLTTAELNETDTLDGENVIPGFSVRVDELFK